MKIFNFHLMPYGAVNMDAIAANNLLNMTTDMLLPPGYTSIASMKRIRAAKINIGTYKTLDDLLESGVVIMGSRETVRQKLAEAQELAGFNTSLTKTQFGTLPADMTRANMEAIAEEILPVFQAQEKDKVAAE